MVVRHDQHFQRGRYIEVPGSNCPVQTCRTYSRATSCTARDYALFRHMDCFRGAVTPRCASSWFWFGWRSCVPFFAAVRYQRPMSAQPEGIPGEVASTGSRSSFGAICCGLLIPGGAECVDWSSVSTIIGKCIGNSTGARIGMMVGDFART